MLLKRTIRRLSHDFRPTLVYNVYGNIVGEVGEYVVNVSTLSKNFSGLLFESHFESGNLWLAYKVSENEYDLVIEPDAFVSLNKYCQWFFFSVKNIKKDQTYIFNIVNMSKTKGSFTYGMQPVMLSMVDLQQQNRGWQRVGSYVSLFPNHFPQIEVEEGKRGTLGTLTFSFTPANNDDTCYFAYHYPYSHTQLLVSEFQVL